MPLTANMTGTIVANGNWQRISTEGEVVVGCDQPFNWAITNASGTTPTVGHTHPAEHYAGSHSLVMKLSADQHLWVKSNTNATFAVTATAPVI